MSSPGWSTVRQNRHRLGSIDGTWLSFSIWKCCGHIEMWVEEASKSEGQAVGHVTCTELVADWAFSLIKADPLFLLSKSRSNRAGPYPGTSNRGLGSAQEHQSCGGTEGTDSANVPRPLY
ncbi:LOW QUALITY PROTEIN: hypothetical protein CFOL_v3_24348 [Cephalotus follicularis]|uniref:Uncharacterized protein n=1 Tax=Cephalotus follicularis TaxID=3775 RepID=A0A1Q3CKW1_CEPFO|nr:LOW QUALITY PROTEIN: hypothetical protein CFOL_v3_24348 [Cephalotus follicularis]